MSNEENNRIQYHHKPADFKSKIALYFVKFLRFFADTFFAKRYGNRAVVLETVAAVPGMVGGAMLHLRSLRRMKNDNGWIETLLDEAENERMHLMTFIEIAKPTKLERFIVIATQGIFYLFYLFIYLCSRNVAHRIVGYLEEEAVVSYTQYLTMIENGEIPNTPAPEIAINYWSMPQDSLLSDVIKAIRADEMRHREVNHCIADKINGSSCKIHLPEGDLYNKEEILFYEKREAP